jgi:hypothetical protein
VSGFGAGRGTISSSWSSFSKGSSSNESSVTISDRKSLARAGGALDHAGEDPRSELHCDAGLEASENMSECKCFSEISDVSFSEEFGFLQKALFNMLLMHWNS